MRGKEGGRERGREGEMEGGGREGDIVQWNGYCCGISLVHV